MDEHEDGFNIGPTWVMDSPPAVNRDELVEQCRQNPGWAARRIEELELILEWYRGQSGKD